MSADGASKLSWARRALLGVALILTAIGVLFVHSTTSRGAPFPSAAARGQLLKAAVGLIAFLVVTRIHYRVIERWAYAIYGALLLVLAGMLAAKAGGRNMFLELDSQRVQPSEFMKAGLVLALARYLRYRDDHLGLRGLRGPILLTLVPLVLVVLQPDLGTSLIFPAILLGMLFVAGTRSRYIVATIVAGIIAVPVLYSVGDKVPGLEGYQLRRIRAFLEQGNEAGDPSGDHLRQSLIALGSGGLTGEGLGQGRQNRLDWLPARHTDFIYSVVGEEWGFVGAACVALLFLVLVALTLRVAVFTREPFGRLAVTGVAMAFAAQSLENMAMTMGLTPITGIPLPFVSLGGSSLFTSYIALAVAFNVAGRHVPVVASRDLDPEGAPARPVLVEEPSPGLLKSRWPID